MVQIGFDAILIFDGVYKLFCFFKLFTQVVIDKTSNTKWFWSKVSKRRFAIWGKVNKLRLLCNLLMTSQIWICTAQLDTLLCYYLLYGAQVFNLLLQTLAWCQSCTICIRCQFDSGWVWCQCSSKWVWRHSFSWWNQSTPLLFMQ